jgi:hypothetical protein
MERHFCQEKKLIEGLGGFQCSVAIWHVFTHSFVADVLINSCDCRAHVCACHTSIKCLTPLWNYDIFRAICALGWTEYF